MKHISINHIKPCKKGTNFSPTKIQKIEQQL